MELHSSFTREKCGKAIFASSVDEPGVSGVRSTAPSSRLLWRNITPSLRLLTSSWSVESDVGTIKVQSYAWDPRQYMGADSASNVVPAAGKFPRSMFLCGMCFFPAFWWLRYSYFCKKPGENTANLAWSDSESSLYRGHGVKMFRSRHFTEVEM